jgi:hypothetical protein
MTLLQDAFRQQIEKHPGVTSGTLKVNILKKHPGVAQGTFKI